MYKAFHEEIHELISEYEHDEILEVSLLHKHIDIEEAEKYFEYVNDNHLMQVTLTDELIDKLGMEVAPYSFYFRNGQRYMLEFTADSSNVSDCHGLEEGFLRRYGDLLERRDIEDFFGLRFRYKSEVRGASSLMGDNVDDLSITSLLEDEREVDFDGAGKTAWSGPGACPTGECIHCNSHCGLHICSHPDHVCTPTGCVMP